MAASLWMCIETSKHEALIYLMHPYRENSFNQVKRVASGPPALCWLRGPRCSSTLEHRQTHSLWFLSLPCMYCYVDLSITYGLVDAKSRAEFPRTKFQVDHVPGFLIYSARMSQGGVDSGTMVWVKLSQEGYDRCSIIACCFGGASCTNARKR